MICKSVSANSLYVEMINYKYMLSLFDLILYLCFKHRKGRATSFDFRKNSTIFLKNDITFCCKSKVLEYFDI